MFSQPCNETSARKNVTSENLQTVLVELFLEHGNDPHVNLGPAGLCAALLEGNPGSTMLMSIPVNKYVSSDFVSRMVLRKISGKLNGMTICFGAYVWNDALVRETIIDLRRRGFRGHIVVGGPQVTYGIAPDKDYPGADIFIRGYAEQALCKVIFENARGIRGVQYAGEPTMTDPCEFDLEKCPSPYLTGVLQVVRSQKVVRWETQRGCPYRCSYCQHQDPNMQSKVQKVPFERLRSELALFMRQGVEEIKIIDPVFNNDKHAIPVLEAMKSYGYKGRISIQCRPELLKECFLAACNGLNIVPEFGLQTIHPDECLAINRKQDIDRVTKAFELLNHHKIRYAVTVIYGLPRQTLSSFQKTVDFCHACRVPEIKAFPLMLLNGCDLDRRREDYCLVTGVCNRKHG